MTSTKPEGWQRLARSAAIVNDASWWLFVVASLIAGGVDWWKANRSAVSFSSDIYLYCAGIGEESKCEVGTSGSGPEQWFTDTAFYSLAAFVVLVIAATAEAFAVGQFMPGIVTVVVPPIGFVLFLAATPDGIASYDGRPVVAMLFVFLAIALRETWARRLRRDYADEE